MTAKSKFEIKLAGVTPLGEREFTGHGSTFGNRDLGGDICVPGCFAKSLERHRDAGTLPVMCWSHDTSKIPGRWISVKEDARGLAVHGELAPTPLGLEVHALLKMEAVCGLSIGFSTVRSDFDRDGNRRLIEVELHEISVCAMPMNQRATVATVKAHDLAVAITNIHDYEKFVRGAYGLSRSVARKFAGRSWPHFAAAVGADQTESEISTLSDDLDAATAVAILRGAATRIRSI